MRSKAEQTPVDLQSEQRIPANVIQTEEALARANLLHALEREGVIPTVSNPNPFNPITQTGEHDRWWQQNPEAGVGFCQAIERRQLALYRLYELASVLSGINR
jgi:hypothetical protein